MAHCQHPRTAAWPSGAPSLLLSLCFVHIDTVSFSVAHKYVRKGAVNTRRYLSKQQVVSIYTHTQTAVPYRLFWFCLEMKATHVRVLSPCTGPYGLIMDVFFSCAQRDDQTVEAFL